MTSMLALLAAFLIVLLIIRMTGLSRRCSELNARFEKARAELERLRRDFDGQLTARTAAIRKVNDDFLYEIQQKTKSEEQLICEKELFRFVISTAPFIVWAFDSDGTLLLAEGKGIDGTGLNPSEVVGKSVFETLKDEPAVMNNCRRALGGESFKACDKAFGRNYQCWYSAVSDTQGRTKKVISFAIDIEELTGCCKQ